MSGNYPEARHWTVYIEGSIGEVLGVERTIAELANRDNLTWTEAIERIFLAGVHTLREEMRQERKPDVG